MSVIMHDICCHNTLSCVFLLVPPGEGAGYFSIFLPDSSNVGPPLRQTRKNSLSLFFSFSHPKFHVFYSPLCGFFGRGSKRRDLKMHCWTFFIVLIFHFSFFPLFHFSILDAASPNPQLVCSLGGGYHLPKPQTSLDSQTSNMFGVWEGVTSSPPLSSKPVSAAAWAFERASKNTKARALTQYQTLSRPGDRHQEQRLSGH